MCYYQGKRWQQTQDLPKDRERSLIEPTQQGTAPELNSDILACSNGGGEEGLVKKKNPQQQKKAKWQHPGRSAGFFLFLILAFRVSQIQSERKKFFYRVSVFKIKIIKNFLSERQYLAYEKLLNELVKK